MTFLSRRCTTASPRRLAFFLSLITFLLASGWVAAAPIGQQVAASAARVWLATNPAPMVRIPGGRRWQANTVRPFKDNSGNTIAYIVDLHPQGFMVVAADDEVEPIITFSTEGRFPGVIGPDDPLADIIAHDIPYRIANKAAMPQAYRMRIIERWGKLRRAIEAESVTSTPAPVTAVTPTVAPLLSTTWGQGYLSGPYTYNYYTPNHLYTGCAATALGQIIRYYQYPASASGTGSIIVNGALRSVSFNDTYNYANMPNQLTGSTPLSQIQETAKLLYTAGITLAMNYGSNGSSATPDASYALKNYFRYASAQWKRGSDSDWVTVLQNELSAGYPAMMAIYGTKGEGHGVVADGWGTENGIIRFHLNMGWDGYENNWYAVPNFTAGGTTWNSMGGYVWNIRKPAGATATYQPDLMLRLAGETSYTGDNIYGQTTGQTRVVQVNPGSMAVYHLKVQNDGNTSDRVTVTGIAGDSNWTVRYFDTLTGGNNITGQVTGSGWVTPLLTAAGGHEMRVEVTPSTTTAGGTSKNVQVTAKSQADAAKSDTVLTTTTTATVKPALSAVSLTGTPASPVAVNTPITLTATPTGGISVEYSFLVAVNGGGYSQLRAYGTGNSIQYTPAAAATFTFQVLAREVGNSTTSDAQATLAYTATTTTTLTGVRMTATPYSPQPVNTVITLTATPTGATNVEYQFAVSTNGGGSYTVIRNYGTTAQTTYTPTMTGNYVFRVWARAVGRTTNYDAAATMGYTVKTLSSTSVSLAGTPASPVIVNTPITLTATPTAGTSLEYSFAVAVNGGGYTQIRAYGTGKSIQYTPTAAGNYTFRVYARAVGNTTAYDAQATLSYLVTTTTTVTGVRMTATPYSPQPVNTMITLTATSTGATNVEYQFAVSTNGGGTYTIIRHYSTTAQCTYTPTAGGFYVFRLWARVVGHTNSYDKGATMGYTVK
ncbi:MAG: C10 family peptidase [Armatimonadota bacterium]